MINIQPFLQRRVVVLHEDATVRQAALAMRDHRIGCVVVADHEGHIVGILTDRDMVNRAMAQDIPLMQTLKISDIMTRDPITVGESTDLKQVLDKMEEYGIRRIPVVQAMPNGLQRCLGVITLDELVVSRSVTIERLSRVIASQLRKRSKRSKLSEDAVQQREMFFYRLQSKLAPDLELSRSELEQLTSLVLGALVRRVHHTGASKFISELPRFTQVSLLELPPGPDETIDLNWLTSEVRQAFQVDDATAHAMLGRFISVLGEWCDPKAILHLEAQLPSDLRTLFTTGAPRQHLRAA